MKKLERKILELGYRPTGKVDTRYPPRGGSGVPSHIPGHTSEPLQKQSNQN
ncbi:MAG: hypothetical protein WC748_02050 [Legionellales bacterium]|jgi:hypothetical protein